MKFQNFVHRFRKDYSIDYFNSKRFWNKNTNPRTVFGIIVSRSLDVSLHFTENLSISGVLYIFRNFANIYEYQMFRSVLTRLSKVFQSYFNLVLNFGLFWMFQIILIIQLISLIIRNRWNTFTPFILYQNFVQHHSSLLCSAH